MVGSAFSFLPKRDTQLDDFSAFVYNEKYSAWMPGDVDPDEWAKENLAGPPPPPKAPTQASVSSSAEASLPNNAATGDAVGKPAEPGGASAPLTPLGGQGDGLSMAPSAGRFSARNANRKPARSRYVDTFNTEDAGADDRQLMPPPPARPKAAPAPYKIFTPQKAGDEATQD